MTWRWRISCLCLRSSLCRQYRWALEKMTACETATLLTVPWAEGLPPCFGPDDCGLEPSKGDGMRKVTRQNLWRSHGAAWQRANTSDTQLFCTVVTLTRTDNCKHVLNSRADIPHTLYQLLIGVRPGISEAPRPVLVLLRERAMEQQSLWMDTHMQQWE